MSGRAEQRSRRPASIRARASAALSGAASIFLAVGGAWYFGAAIWWLNRHYWPHASLRVAGVAEPAVSAGQPVVTWLWDSSPGKLALLLAISCAVLARLADAPRPQR